MSMPTLALLTPLIVASCAKHMPAGHIEARLLKVQLSESRTLEDDSVRFPIVIFQLEVDSAELLTEDNTWGKMRFAPSDTVYNLSRTKLLSESNREVGLKYGRSSLGAAAMSEILDWIDSGGEIEIKLVDGPYEAPLFESDWIDATAYTALVLAAKKGH